MSILKRFFGIERRSTVRNPEPWLVTALGGGGPTVSGENVGPEKALTLSAYYAALRAISEDIAKLPLILYRRLQPQGKERLTEHPLHHLLHDRPNPETSAMTLRETMTAHALGWGNGYAEVVRDATGVVRALWLLDPRRVRVERAPDKTLRYVVHTQTGKPITLLPSEVFHLHGLGFDGLTGYSVAQLARESIGAGLGAEKSGAAMFGNASVPVGVLEHPKRLDDAAVMQLREQWEIAHKGSANAHKTALLCNGVVWKSIGIPNRDSQWLESRQFTVVEMARWFRIPPHKIASLERATFSNIADQSREYVTDTLQPWLVRWEQEIQAKLIPPGTDLFAEHLVAGLLRGDTKTRFESYASAINAGWMSRNEARSLENLNPLDGLDEMLSPMNMAPTTERGSDTS